MRVETHPHLADRLRLRTLELGPDDCWPWQGAKIRTGYGVIAYRNQTYLAHRIAYVVANGPVPEGLFVCHHCDHPACCNPRHLFVATNAANTIDKLRKNRQPRGEECPNHKLTWEHVRAARQRYATERISYRKLAAEYGVNKQTMWELLAGWTWQDDPLLAQSC